MCFFVNVSGWMDPVDMGCNGRSFTSGGIFGGERSWYGGKGSCKWCHIIDVTPHTYVTHKYTSMNASDWIHSIGWCCNERSFTSGGISVGERSWYRGQGWCKWCHIVDVKPPMNMSVWMHQIRNTPLMDVARNGHLAVVEYLVGKGADMEARDRVRDVIALIWSQSYRHICISLDGLHWYVLHRMVVYQRLNICWRKELIRMLKIM